MSRLNKLFGLRPSEIADLEGVKHGSEVRGLIIRVSDQLSAGEISLWEVDPDEAAEAKDRPDTSNLKSKASARDQEI